MPLRSLHLDAGRTWRGGQRQVYLLAQTLRARGHEPLIVGTPASPLLERAQSIGIATASARMRADLDLRSAKRVRSLVRTWRPDVVHAHDARSHAIALIALAGDSTPLVVTRRVTFPLKSVKVKYGQRVARFIAISSAVKQAMMRSGVDGSRIDVVHSGVPTPGTRSAVNWRHERSWPAATIVAGVVGAMTAEKGIETLEAIANLLPPETAAATRLVLLGGAGRGRTRIGALETFEAGFVSEIYDAMAGLDVLWHPASDEGLGTALLDAMALGVPPIAFSVGGIPEIVTDGENGLLVRVGDISAFVAAHIRLLDAGFRHRLGEAGPNAATRFSVENMTDGTEQVYDKVLNS